MGIDRRPAHLDLCVVSAADYAQLAVACPWFLSFLLTHATIIHVNNGHLTPVPISRVELVSDHQRPLCLASARGLSIAVHACAVLCCAVLSATIETNAGLCGVLGAE